MRYPDYNYYEILEVNPKATKEIIKKAFNTLAKRYHPDVTSMNKNEAAVMFKRVKEAFDVLSDDNLRMDYDKYLASKQSSYQNNCYDDNLRKAEDNAKREKARAMSEEAKRRKAEDDMQKERDRAREAEAQARKFEERLRKEEEARYEAENKYRNAENRRKNEYQARCDAEYRSRLILERENQYKAKQYEIYEDYTAKTEQQLHNYKILIGILAFIIIGFLIFDFSRTSVRYDVYIGDDGKIHMPEEDFSYWQKNINLAPWVDPYYIPTRRMDPNLYNLLFDIKYYDDFLDKEKFNPAKAIKSYEKLLDILPFGSPMIENEIGRLYENRFPNKYGFSRDLNKAIYWYKRAIEHNFKDVIVYKLIAFCYYDLGNYKKAKEYFDMYMSKETSDDSKKRTREWMQQNLYPKLRK